MEGTSMKRKQQRIAVCDKEALFVVNTYSLLYPLPSSPPPPPRSPPPCNWVTFFSRSFTFVELSARFLHGQLQLSSRSFAAVPLSIPDIRLISTTNSKVKIDFRGNGFIINFEEEERKENRSNKKETWLFPNKLCTIKLLVAMQRGSSGGRRKTRLHPVRVCWHSRWWIVKGCF